MVPGPGYCHHEKLEWFLDQDIAIKSSWNGSWTRILPSSVAGMVPGPGYVAGRPGYCHQEYLEWFLNQDIAIKSSWNCSWTRIWPSRVAGMVPGPGYCHQE